MPTTTTVQVTIEGISHELEDREYSGKELRDVAGLRPRTSSCARRATGPRQPYRPGASCDRTRATTSSCRCASAGVEVHPRLRQEWENLVMAYPDAQHLTDPERVLITVELEAGAYSRDSTPVCVLIPPGYPTTGPDGFMVPAELALGDGSTLPASDAAGIGLPGWHLISFHYIDANGASTWRPTAEPRRGDNMIAYLDSVEAFLVNWRRSSEPGTRSSRHTRIRVLKRGSPSPPTTRSNYPSSPVT